MLYELKSKPLKFFFLIFCFFMVGLLHDLMTEGACISPQNGYSSLLTNFLQGEGKICDPGTVCNVHLSYPENSDSELHLVFSVGHHKSTDLYV